MEATETRLERAERLHAKALKEYDIATRDREYAASMPGVVTTLRLAEERLERARRKRP